VNRYVFPASNVVTDDSIVKSVSVTSTFIDPSALVVGAEGPHAVNNNTAMVNTTTYFLFENMSLSPLVVS
jgi:hypothetical protein